MSGKSPSEAVDCVSSALCLLAAGQVEGYGGNLYYATSLGGGWTQAYSPSYGVDAISCVSASFCVDGQDGVGFFRWSTKPASTSWNSQYQGAAAMKAVSCISVSFCAIADGKGSVHVATTESQVKSSTWKETDVDGTTALNGIACTSTSSCVAVDSAGDALKLSIASEGAATASKNDIDGSTSITAVSCPGSSTCVAVDAAGNVFITENGGGAWTKLNAFGDDLTAISCPSSSLCAAVDTAGRVMALSLSGGSATEGEARSPQPGTTVEYNVPVSGAGAPQNLSKEEVEKWGQQDDPIYATAILPPEHPQGWPAMSLTGATVSYMDSRARAVNVSGPNGGIATTEYNEENDVTRSLSAGNRAKALAEGCESKEKCKSAEAASKLATQSTYSAETGDLTETKGPEHLVQLKDGEKIEARNTVRYGYGQGPPGYEQDGLVTKTTDVAVASGKEYEKRASTTSYSGQSNLGWKLRAPTSTTTDPNGLNLVHTTIYEPATGNVVETRSPSANDDTALAPESAFSFGGSGSGAGQLDKPAAVAANANGDVWVADTGHNRVQEFNSKGEFLREFGEGQLENPRGIVATSAGDVYVANFGGNDIDEYGPEGALIRAWGARGTEAGDLNNPVAIALDSKGDLWSTEEGNGGTLRVQEFSSEGAYITGFGSYGSEHGQFKQPSGIAVGSSGDVYVADTGNNRIQEFAPKGEFIRAFGKEGTGSGEFKGPIGLALNSEGDLWVADRGNSRLQRFTPEGSYLSQLGAEGNNNGQFDEPEGVSIDASGNLWVADTENNRVQELSGTEFVRTFGGEGSGGGQLQAPAGIARDSAGNIWVADTGHDRVQEFNSKGEFVREIGADGEGHGQFKSPHGIAVSAAGNVYVADAGNNRVQELNSKGEFIRAFGSAGTGGGQFVNLAGVAVDAEGHVWTIQRGYQGSQVEGDEPRMQEFSAEGAFIKQWKMSEGSSAGQLKTPEGIAIDGKGDVWIADTGNNRVQEFKSSGEFTATFGTEGSGEGQLKAPTSLAFDSEGNLWVADSRNDRMEHFTPTGRYLGQVGTAGNESGQFSEPHGVAIDALGDIWVADTGNNRVQEFVGTEFVRKFGGSGSGAGQLEAPGAVAIDAEGNMWVLDTGHDRVQEFNAKGEFMRELGAKGEADGEFNQPHGIAVNTAGDVYVADGGNHRVQEFNSKGEFIRSFGSRGAAEGKFVNLRGLAVDSEGHVWTIEAGGATEENKKIVEVPPRVQEFSATGGYMSEFGAEGTKNGQFEFPQGIAIGASGDVYVADTRNDRIQEFTAAGEFVRAFGSAGSEDGKFREPTGIAAGPEGHLWVVDDRNNRIQWFTAEGGYLGQLGAKGNNKNQFEDPEGIAVGGSATDVVIADTGNNRVDVVPLEQQSGDGTTAVTLYYTASADPAHPECGERPEWDGLLCETLPGKQPETEGLPNLPVTRVEYNIYDQPEKKIETFGANSRTETTSFNEAGWPLSATLTGTIGQAMPKITDHYEEATGALVEQTSELEGKTLAVKRAINSLGQASSYTDATGNTTSYSYDEYGRLHEVNYDAGMLDGMEAWQRYGYEETTGRLSEINDSAAGIFKASYGVEGEITSETWPNKMTETIGYDSVGEAVSKSYVKNECSSKCTWFEDKISPSVHGETLSQESSLADVSYGYDEVGRLTEAKEAPVGEGCSTRLYAYDVESDRTSQTSRKPAAGNQSFPKVEGGSWEGKACAIEGGETQSHSYDEASRLIDIGTAYDGFGDIIKLPASDAGGQAIESSFYTDGQLAKQVQGELEHIYTLDPEGRTMSEGAWKKSKEGVFEQAAETIEHYAGTGGTPSWSYDETNGKWTRQISGFQGLVAVQESGGAPVLQMPDLEGNVVETASMSTTATEPLTRERSTEFGVPTSEKPAQKYNWLGGFGLSSSFESTGVTAKDGSTYVPQIGRALQTTSTSPPIPTDQAVPFESSLEPWEVEGGAAAAAEETASYEEKLRRIKEAVATNWEEEYAMGGPSLLEQMPEEGSSYEEESGMGSAGGQIENSPCATGETSGSGACGGSLCDLWPYCQGLERYGGNATAWARPAGKECHVAFAGRYMTCGAAIKLAKKDYKGTPWEKEVLNDLEVIVKGANEVIKAAPYGWREVTQLVESVGPFL